MCVLPIVMLILYTPLLFRGRLSLMCRNRIKRHLIHFITFPLCFAVGDRLKRAIRFAYFCQWYTDSKMTWLRGHLVNCAILPVCRSRGNEMVARGTVIHASHIMKNKLSKLWLLLRCFFPPSVLSVCKLLLMYMKRCALLCMRSAVCHTVSEGVALGDQNRKRECINLSHIFSDWSDSW